MCIIFCTDIGGDNGLAQWPSSSRRQQQRQSRQETHAEENGSAVSAERPTSRLRQPVSRYSPEPESIPIRRHRSRFASGDGADLPNGPSAGVGHMGTREGLRSRGDAAAGQSSHGAAFAAAGSSAAAPVLRLRVSGRLQGLATPLPQQLLRSGRTAEPGHSQGLNHASAAAESGRRHTEEACTRASPEPAMQWHIITQRSLRSNSAQPQSPPLPNGIVAAGLLQRAAPRTRAGRAGSNAPSSSGRAVSFEADSASNVGYTPVRNLRSRIIAAARPSSSQTAAEAEETHDENAGAYSLRRHSRRPVYRYKSTSEDEEDQMAVPRHANKHRSLTSLQRERASRQSSENANGSAQHAVGRPSEAANVAEPSRAPTGFRIRFRGDGRR